MSRSLSDVDVAPIADEDHKHTSLSAVVAVAVLGAFRTTFSFLHFSSDGCITIAVQEAALSH